MVFSSITFLFLFLPLVLVLYFLIDNIKYRNFVLLFASLFFYTWGERGLVLIMVFSIIMNYLVGIGIHSKQNYRKALLATGVSLNLLMIGYFKYANFIVDNVGSIFRVDFENLPIHLPIGISFFTFQSISYLIDVYRGDAKVQKNPLNLALYISLFPQLIAGPIVRYTTIANEIVKRKVTASGFYSGVIRFIEGLAKKVLIANTLGLLADTIMDEGFVVVNFDLAWLGIIAYSLQIYFDFSGYSDMAIGLGRMFGFHFLENFNFPYISSSIQEFWRRWHISLSTWFRDYLYIPLGGNRVGKIRVYVNLIIVFFLTGLWHGASWNFVLWGLFHGVFLIFERLGWAKFMKRVPFLGNAYTLFVVIVGWVFFRIETFDSAIEYLRVMFSFGYHTQSFIALDFLNTKNKIVLVLGILLATGIVPFVKKKVMGFLKSKKSKLLFSLYELVIGVSYFMILGLTFISLASSTYNPFIYFRF